jgi:uncharacterized protein (TIGR03083 family)
MDRLRLARDDRAQLLDLLETLSPDQWETPSLCEGWRVRDVVAHVFSYDGVGWPGMLRYLVENRFQIDRINALRVTEWGVRSIDELLDFVRAHLTPQGPMAALGGRIALTDAVIHQQDIRRPLGRPREIPADRLLQALNGAIAAPVIGSRPRIRGLRLVATDADWSTGHGPEVRGTAEALLMAATGRHGVVDELTGPGRQTLAARIGG